MDLLVALKDGDKVPTKLFVVQVQGTLSSVRRQWVESGKQLFNDGQHYLPV